MVLKSLRMDLYGVEVGLMSNRPMVQKVGSRVQ